MVAVTATANLLAEDYTNQGAYVYIGLANGDPGSGNKPLNEASGGSYARVKTTWQLPANNGVVTGTSVTINVPDGTYYYMIFCQQSTGANMVDNCRINGSTGVVVNGSGGNGQVQIIPTYTQS
jgi:hypothetical protein